MGSFNSVALLPLHLYVPFTCTGPLRFSVALVHLYGPFTAIWGRLAPVRPPVGGKEVLGWSAQALFQNRIELY